MDFFPDGFPTQARARVEAEKILSYRSLDTSGKKVFSGIATDALVRDCIVRIFLVFAEELCALGQEKGWGLDLIDSEGKEFLRKLSITVLSDKSPGLYRFWIDSTGGSLTQDAKHQLRQSPEWRKYENLLLAVAAAQVRQPRTKGRQKANESPGNRRALIDTFISDVMSAGQRITRKQIWTVAGYTNATEFERFQRGDARTTQSAKDNFTRVLNMKPEEFIQGLKAFNKK